jgi:hypothetical protein
MSAKTALSGRANYVSRTPAAPNLDNLAPARALVVAAPMSFSSARLEPDHGGLSRCRPDPGSPQVMGAPTDQTARQSGSGCDATASVGPRGLAA